MPLQDAHCHYQNPCLAAHEAQWVPQLLQSGVTSAIVNGTRESDWPHVTALVQRLPWCRPAFGLHPWYLAENPPGWPERLAALLQDHPKASLGECGLDRWMDQFDPAQQASVLRQHLALARQFNRPVTIHCLRAWGALLSLLQQSPLPPCGFLLHAYGGPAEMVPQFVKLGAYFSFSPYFLRPRKAAAREIFAKAIPIDRLLIETDAPSMLPPVRAQLAHIPGAPHASHPLNLLIAAQGLAHLRDWSLEETSAVTTANFARFFG